MNPKIIEEGELSVVSYINLTKQNINNNRFNILDEGSCSVRGAINDSFHQMKQAFNVE